MSQNPVWLLDFDDVLNIYPLKGEHIKEAKSPLLYGREWPLSWDTRVIDYVRRIIQIGLVDVFWCTSWEEKDGVRHIEKLLDLPRLRSSHAYTMTQAVTVSAVAASAKFEWYGGVNQVSKRLVGERMSAIGRFVIWTDDDEYVLPMVEHSDYLEDDTRLLIRPRDGQGLRLMHLDVIQAKIKELHGLS